MRFLPPSRLVPSRCALAILIVVHGAILGAQPAIGARRHGAERWQQVWAPPPAGSRVP